MVGPVQALSYLRLFVNARLAMVAIPPEKVIVFRHTWFLFLIHIY